ncbi:MAG: TraR/DksA C4-type zinc finger protein [Coriobacteriia bacterium]|nr:TraR/DksA C4-type zinc finger protein [Coriobacteriia bacterium]
MNTTRIASFAAVLEVERERVRAEIAEFELEDQESLSEVSGENNYRDHMADQGSATFARELDMTLEESARERLARIERALARIEADTYGVCVRCGGTVSIDRLEAMPEASLCIACKEHEENA